MALSQVLCLDNNHVNLRTNEAKPEFFYSEEQRLALETLVDHGRNSFENFIQTNNMRAFLSDLELDYLTRVAEAFHPGADDFQHGFTGENNDTDLSMQYWPELSDYSLPDLDLGWPESSLYRGVTRVNIYAQPPVDGQTHIKEVVRKTIAQAQKVIAVVMDLFTDVDIFKDLLDAGFKRKVAVYIILEATSVPAFLRMCEGAEMHTGHLKNLRVRWIRGKEFFTRSSKKVCGHQSQKFMFVDGDKAISGSYSFTWSASRLDRNIITVFTGQAVDTFDGLFQDLYLMSSCVSLSQLNLDDEPLRESLLQPAPTPPPSVSMALKLLHPKYSLAFSNAADTSKDSPSDKTSAKNNNLRNGLKSVKRVREQELVPAIHPGLLHMERANMVRYLPTWPEPDPPGDVIGFINVRDASKPVQAHLTRSELFETSRAVHFKAPLQVPEEPLPENVWPRPKAEHPMVSPATAKPQPISWPTANQEVGENNGNPLEQVMCSDKSYQMKVPALLTPVIKPRTAHLPLSNENAKTTSVFTDIEKAKDSESTVNHSVKVPVKATTSFLCLSTPETTVSQEQSKEPKTQNILQSTRSPATVTSHCDIESSHMSRKYSKTPPSSFYTEMTSVHVNGEGTATRSIRKSSVKDSPDPRDIDTGEADRSLREADSISWPDIDSTSNYTTLSSTSEEYFDCSDSWSVDSRSEALINDINDMQLETDPTGYDRNGNSSSSEKLQQKHVAEEPTGNVLVGEPGSQHSKKLSDVKMLTSLKENTDDKFSLEEVDQRRGQEERLGTLLSLSDAKPDGHEGLSGEKAQRLQVPEMEANPPSLLSRESCSHSVQGVNGATPHNPPRCKTREPVKLNEPPGGTLPVQNETEAQSVDDTSADLNFAIEVDHIRCSAPREPEDAPQAVLEKEYIGPKPNEERNRLHDATEHTDEPLKSGDGGTQLPRMQETGAVPPPALNSNNSNRSVQELKRAVPNTPPPCKIEEQFGNLDGEPRRRSRAQREGEVLSVVNSSPDLNRAVETNSVRCVRETEAAPRPISEEGSAGAKPIEQRNCSHVAAEMTDAPLILEDRGTHQSVEAKDFKSSSTGEDKTVLMVLTKDKEEKPVVDTENNSGFIDGSQQRDVRSPKFVRDTLHCPPALTEEKHTYINQEKRSHLYVRAKQANEVRKPHRVTPKPSLQTQTEASQSRASSAKATATKPDSSSHPKPKQLTRPPAHTVGAPGHTRGKIHGQSRLGQSAPTQSAMRLHIPGTAQAQRRRSQPDHSPSSPPPPRKRVQSHLDQSGPNPAVSQSKVRELPATTTADAHSSSRASQAKNLKRKVTGPQKKEGCGTRGIFK